jgi:hypothetical protein
MVESGPHLPDANWRTFAVHYTSKEKATQPLPYPGLEAFKKDVRFTRDRCFGDPKDTREYVK